MSGATLRVALADDQALVLSGLRALLRDLGVEIAVEAADGRALLAQLEHVRVDVVVSDIRMPVATGIDVVRGLRARGDRTPVLLLTTFDDSALLLAAVRAGAQGFLLKDASPDDLQAALQALARGDTLLQPVALDPVRDALPDETASRAPLAKLTDREVSVLRLVAGGYSNKEIGRTLFLSEGTVKNYVSEILLKLDCRDRTHAVMKAITQRLI
jgi:DNA-binding NarL/FixJ family response regulator